MAAGDRADFDRARPLLEQLTRRLDYLGPVGNGAAMKLAINLPLMVYWGALGEAVGLLGNRGIPYEQAFEILTDSSGAIGPAKMRQTPIIELLKTGTSGVSNFAIDQALKDMALMAALARQSLTVPSSPPPKQPRNRQLMLAGQVKTSRYWHGVNTTRVITPSFYEHFSG